MITIQGQAVFPDTDEAPSLYSIGYGLARTARFAGQTKIWYPVLAHIYSVASIVSSAAEIHALLHDAAESVVGDQVTTWKNEDTKLDENIIIRRIYRNLGLTYPREGTDVAIEVKIADAACLAAEAKVLGHSMPNHPHFEQVRKDHHVQYHEALERTEYNVGYFTPEYCINHTDDAAQEFERYATTLLPQTVAS